MRKFTDEEEVAIFKTAIKKAGDAYTSKAEAAGGQAVPEGQKSWDETRQEFLDAEYEAAREAINATTPEALANPPATEPATEPATTEPETPTGEV